jgi:hypothetical protein
MMFDRKSRITALLCCGVALAGACDRNVGVKNSSTGDVASNTNSSAKKSGARTGADRNACDLLTIEEVSAAAGVPVTAKESHRETGRSDCDWDSADGTPRFALVGYWTGGKEGWDILAGSRGMARDIIKRDEGVGLDSIMKAGPISGLGDKAFFSPLLTSLVLKDNVLLEFTTSLLPKPQVQFRPLAMKALSRL